MNAPPGAPFSTARTASARLSHPALSAGLSALLVLFLLEVVVLPADAYHTGVVTVAGLRISETIVLPRNNYAGYTFALGIGDRITYDIRVTSGGPIDMYVVSADNLQKYRNDSSVAFFPTLRVENRTTISGAYTATASTAGPNTVIVDNVDLSGAVPTGLVTVSVNLTRESPQGPSPVLLGGVIVAVVIGMAVVVVLVLRARRKPAGNPPPSPYPGAPGPNVPPPYVPPPYTPRGPYPPPPP
jgi:hypothetical protein